MEGKAKIAFDFLEYTQENLFITGKAGTGKTTFLRYLLENTTKKAVVVAPTGVAAIQANGVTMHSMFQLPFGMYISQYKKQWGVAMDNNIVNQHQLLSQIRINAQKRKLLQNVELIIVDEVSMVRADYMDAMDAVLRFVRRKDVAFGGCQMLFIGDMYQLPPVVQNHERHILLEHYNSSYFFDAHVMNDKPPICIEFDKIYRQTDERFIALLNNVRNNQMSNDDYELLHTRYFPNIAPAQPGVITISSHNATVEAINTKALAELHTKSQVFTADVTGSFPESAFPMPQILELKEGAQVMFTKNDKGDKRRFYNGKIGEIIRINRFDNTITISSKGDMDDITIEPERWENIKYNYDEINDKIDEEVIGTFQQFPLKLAWAVTIHKSQGMTFDEAIIDAGQSFAPGQVYVALSRLRTLDGLYLKSEITSRSVMIDPHIVAYFKENTNTGPLDNALKYGRLNYLENEFSKYFDFRGIDEEINSIALQYLTDGQSAEFAMNSTRLSILHEHNTLHSHGIRFIPFIKEKVQIEDWNGLYQRYNKATLWYVDAISQSIIDIVQEEIDQLKVKKNSTKFIQTFHQIKLLFKKWIAGLKHYNVVLENLASTGEIAEALGLMKDKTILADMYAEELPKKMPSHQITIQLFKKYRDINKVMEERTLKESTVYGHFVKGISDKTLDVFEVVSQEIYLKVLDIMKKHPRDVSVNILKERLGDEVTFEMINMVKAHVIAHNIDL